ncbi:T9SS type A sorting domain-containing protein [Flavobacteriaceae bacterium MHTCC 0001]
MKNNYFSYFFLIIFFFFAQIGFSQTSFSSTENKGKIEGLSVYPNPVSNTTTTIYITSNSKDVKVVSVFNVLGKPVISRVSTLKAVDISSLNSGVYILKITESGTTETRKLVVK